MAGAPPGRGVRGAVPTALSPTLLARILRVLVWSQQNYLKFLLIVRYFGSS